MIGMNKLNKRVPKLDASSKLEELEQKFSHSWHNEIDPSG
tara:strand:+ start:281 stop:400 length:120 start_codon:yes stop_codon:yes gene_type:complete